jgi:hypothetical protein
VIFAHMQQVAIILIKAAYPGMLPDHLILSR